MRSDVAGSQHRKNNGGFGTSADSLPSLLVIIALLSLHLPACFRPARPAPSETNRPARAIKIEMRYNWQQTDELNSWNSQCAHFGDSQSESGSPNEVHHQFYSPKMNFRVWRCSVADFVTGGGGATFAQGSIFSTVPLLPALAHTLFFVCDHAQGIAFRHQP